MRDLSAGAGTLISRLRPSLSSPGLGGAVTGVRSWQMAKKRPVSGHPLLVQLALRCTSVLLVHLLTRSLPLHPASLVWDPVRELPNGGLRTHELCPRLSSPSSSEMQRWSMRPPFVFQGKWARFFTVVSASGACSISRRLALRLDKNMPEG